MTPNVPHDVPAGARPAARVLLVDGSDRILYLRAREDRTGKEFWVMPGGGIKDTETFEEAAIRELKEETGLEVKLGPCVWTRRHVFKWEGRELDQYEVFFFARTGQRDIEPIKQDDYVV